jgi:putative ABC transport system permease protein
MINGSLPSTGTIAVLKDVAVQLSLNIGDKALLSFVKINYLNLNGTYRYVNQYVNYTFIVSQIWTQNSDHGKSVPRFSPVILNMADLESILSNETITTSHSIHTQYMVWINRAHVISIGDLTSTTERLQFIENRLNLIMGTLEVQIIISNLIMKPIQDSMSQLDNYKATFFALSLPIIVLGVYISMVGVELGMRNRRREIGVLKARGASKQQVYSNMMFESIVLGTFSGVIGMVFGIVFSRILLSSTVSFMGAYGNAQLTDISITIETITIALFIGIALMIISSYRSVMKATRIDVAEALHYYVPGESEREYNFKWDLACVAFVILAIISVIFLSVQNVSQQSNSFFIQVILITLLALGVAIVPLMPLLLSVSLVRLITRGPKKLYTRFSRLVKPWTKQLHYIVERNVERNPKRASNLTMIIALALALGLFTSGTMESELGYEMEQIRVQLGSDVMIDSAYFHEHLNLSRLNELGNINSMYSYCVGYVFLEENMVAVDTKSYYDTVRPADYWFIERNAIDSLMGLEENGTALVSERALNNYGEVGNNIVTSFYYPTSQNSSDYKQYNLTLKIIGTFKDLPGLHNDVLVNLSAVSAVLTQQKILNGSLVGARAFIKMKDGESQSSAAIQGEKIFNETGFKSTYSLYLDSALEDLKYSQSYGALAGFFNSEYAMAIITMSVGVAIIISITVTDRKQELACIIARGASTSQMRRMLMGESISLMALGVVIGTSVGLLTAYLFNLLTANLSGALGHYLVFTWVSFILIFISIISLFFASLLATARAGKIRLAEILRIRGG